MALAAVWDGEDAVVHDIEAQLERQVGRPRVGLDVPDENVVKAVRWLLREPGVLARGDLATTVERLSDHWGNALREVLVGGAPYNARWCAIDAWSTMRNEGQLPLQIIRQVRVRPIPTRTTGPGGATREVSDAHRVETESVVIDPGEEIELQYDRAVGALRRFSWDALQAEVQATTSQSRNERRLREVAYRAEWRDEDGEIVRVDSRVSDAGDEPRPTRRRRPA
jgi:hypothetical protein